MVDQFLNALRLYGILAAYMTVIMGVRLTDGPL